MECYLLSEPKARGYREHMLRIKVCIKKRYVLGIRTKTS